MTIEGIFSRAAAEHAGHDLIAVGNQHRPSSACRRGPWSPRCRKSVHGWAENISAHTSHGNAAAYADGGHQNGGTAATRTPAFHIAGMSRWAWPGDDLTEGADHADQRPVQLLIGITQCVKQNGGWALPAHAFCHLFTVSQRFHLSPGPYANRARFPQYSTLGKKTAKMSQTDAGLRFFALSFERMFIIKEYLKGGRAVWNFRVTRSGAALIGFWVILAGAVVSIPSGR